MKSCTYCGRENEDEAAFCQECGTEIGLPPLAPPPEKPPDWSAVRFAVFAAGIFSMIVALYLLSFGPVMCWTGNYSSVSTTNGTTFTTAVTIKCPEWVGIIYYPAFKLIENGETGDLADLYSRYVGWWTRSREPN